jgi:glycosyltransferase involved in cell wall biosynthesis
MRILHLISGLSPRFGGPSKIVDLCEELSRQGVNISLFSNDLDRPGSWNPWRPSSSAYNNAHESEPRSFEIRFFPTRWPSRFGYSPKMAREIALRIREFDLVHVHGLYLHPNLSGCFHARRNGIPYMIEPHGSLAPVIHRHHRYRKWFYEAAFERRNLNRASALHFASTVEMRQAQQLGFTAPGLVLPLGVKLEEFDHLPSRGWFRKRYGQLQDKRLVVFFGRLTRKKGLELLVDAFAIIAHRLPDTHLVIAGPDDEKCGERIAKQARLRGLSNRVTLTGMLVGEERLGLFADTDVWILPSFDENFGIAAVEAMACRLAVVLSDNVHIGRQAAEAEAALVVPCEPKRLAEAVESLLVNPGLRRRLGHRAREFVRREYTWVTSARRIAEAYETIIQSRPSPSLPRSMPVVERGTQ